MKKLKYDYLACEEKAKKLGFDLKTIFSELDEYAEDFVLCWLANRHNIDVRPNVVDCTYTSVWDGEGEITAKAKVNINTRKVDILESFDPAECFTEDGDPFECEILASEYVTIDGVNYQCHREDDCDDTWEDWTPETGFYYE